MTPQLRFNQQVWGRIVTHPVKLLLSLWPPISFSPHPLGWFLPSKLCSSANSPKPNHWLGLVWADLVLRTLVCHAVLPIQNPFAQPNYLADWQADCWPNWSQTVEVVPGNPWGLALQHAKKHPATERFVHPGFAVLTNGSCLPRHAPSLSSVLTGVKIRSSVGRAKQPMGSFAGTDSTSCQWSLASAGNPANTEQPARRIW